MAARPPPVKAAAGMAALRRFSTLDARPAPHGWSSPLTRAARV